LLQARLTLGQVLEASGRPDDALKEYRAMAAAHPKLAAPDFHIGAALHARGDLAGAAAAYGRALEKDPEFGPALNNLAAIELGRKANDKAEALAQRAVKSAPQDAAFRDTHAEVLAARGDLRGAAAEQRQAVKLEPGNPAYLARLGLLQAKLGQKDEARKSLSGALGMSQQFAGAAEARKALDSLQR
jgi:tetratricopeptide (TPR) repeat protein